MPNNWVNPGSLRNLGLGMGGGQALGGLAGLFGWGQGKNPADVANQTLNKIPGAMQPYYSPYQEAGKGALSDLQNQYGNLTNNTGDVYNKLAGGYKESPGYQFQLHQALEAGNNQAAAGGIAGSPAAQQANMGVAQGLASQDYNNYLNSVLGLYGQGLQGQQGLNQMGYNANTDYANMLGSNLGQQAQYGYAGQAGKNQASSGSWQNLLSGLGTALPFLL